MKTKERGGTVGGWGVDGEHRRIKGGVKKKGERSGDVHPRVSMRERWQRWGAEKMRNT